MKKKLTLLQLFTLYPIIIKGVAERMEMSRPWLSGLIYGRIYARNHKKVAVLKQIEAEIHKLGIELTQIEIINNNENTENQ
jgi:hypothetical protein